jgi:hypothetical protein
MRILVACEFSGRVRDAFNALGHNAVSCDLQPSDTPGPHIEGDIREHMGAGWDAMIAFPPCTYLTCSGVSWHYGSPEMERAIAFVQELWAAPIERVAIENPVGVLSTRFRKPDQYIQPWQYGHGEVKRTCLWLKNLPPLRPTSVVAGREPRILRMGNGYARQRSITYAGIAAAMASQWGNDDVC